MPSSPASTREDWSRDALTCGPRGAHAGGACMPQSWSQCSGEHAAAAGSARTASATRQDVGLPLCCVARADISASAPALADQRLHLDPLQGGIRRRCVVRSAAPHLIQQLGVHDRLHKAAHGDILGFFLAQVDLRRRNESPAAVGQCRRLLPPPDDRASGTGRRQRAAGAPIPADVHHHLIAAAATIPALCEHNRPVDGPQRARPCCMVVAWLTASYPEP
eukprot:56357-Chlamydomonas_euryale.AAC.6